ncbi:hypothetical protein [Hyphomicrobium sp. 2TAF46]|uniref:hypothetical protein n=1 Tax=Hyphomicrobium sp. 2TAF46 TaxID=3233019 RepID=UPI003F8D9D61
MARKAAAKSAPARKSKVKSKTAKRSSVAATGKPSWLLKPPHDNQIHFRFSHGKDVKLTPVSLRALEDLSRELFKNEYTEKKIQAAYCDPKTCGICQPECSPLGPGCYDCSICNPKCSSNSR